MREIRGPRPRGYSLLSGLVTDATVATSIRSVTKNAPLSGGLRCFCMRTMKVSGLTASLPGWTFGRSKPESYVTCDLIARRTLTGIDAIYQWRPSERKASVRGEWSA